MRKVVLGLGISLDGYIARPDGAADFLFMPKDYSMGPFFATIDSAVMGRKTYDVSRKMGGGGFGDSKMKSYVFSDSQPPGERAGDRKSTRLNSSHGYISYAVFCLKKKKVALHTPY